ncbi:MAG: hypothetical protein IKS49_05145 [Actinomycetaceae bacterium]|nr:hypothetical protein [Actinomycetaceae bacterium]
MAISKKLMALFAGVLLAGSFGLAGCDDSGSSGSGAGSSDTRESNSEVNSGSSSDNESENDSQKITFSDDTFFGDEYTNTGVAYPIDGSNPKYPNAVSYITRDTWNEYREYYDEWCWRTLPVDEAALGSKEAKEQMLQQGYRYQLLCHQADTDDDVYVYVKF